MGTAARPRASSARAAPAPRKRARQPGEPAAPRQPREPQAPKDGADLLEFSARRRLPMIYQAEAAECGFACLAMIACYHRRSTDLGAMRRQGLVSSRGSSLKDLLSAAAGLGLEGRAVKLDMDALPCLDRPCILHWDMNHFVALRECSKTHIVIHDPAKGVRKLPVQEAAKHFTGIALELTPGAGFEAAPKKRRVGLSILWQRIIGLRLSLAVILILSLLLQAYAIAAPFYLQTTVDDVLLRNDTGLLKVLAMGFGLLLLIEVGTQALRETVVLHLSSRLHLQLGSNLFRHLLRLPVNYFQRRHLGDVLSRFSSLDAVREALSKGLVLGLVDGIMALLMMAVMFYYHWQLTLIVLAALLIYCIVRLLLYGPMRRLIEEELAGNAESETSFIESLRAIETLKMQQREPARHGHWLGCFANTLNKRIGLGQLQVWYQAANTFLFGLENLIVIYLAAYAVMAGEISVGMLFAFTSYKRHFLQAAESFVNQAFELRALSVHLERLADIIHAAPEHFPTHASGPAAVALEEDGESGGSLDGGGDRDGGRAQAGKSAAKGAARLQESSASRSKESGGAMLEVKGLRFHFNRREPPLFSNLSFTIAAGEMVAIRAPSGAGKTTLLKCLMGLLEADGIIEVDGIGIDKLSDYRARVAAVLQDDHLLSGSITDNICGFDETPDIPKVRRCSKLACMHDAIMKMPMQYATLVGDMGGTLSGGQRQRIILARALYRAPDILFLDEATSHLDPQIEARINKNITALKMTRVIVAHRPQTIKLADRVINLESRE